MLKDKVMGVGKPLTRASGGWTRQAFLRCSLTRAWRMISLPDT